MLKTVSEAAAEEDAQQKPEAEPRRGSNMAFTIDLADKKDADASPSAPVAAQAFTVDFGATEGEDERRLKRLGMRDSLSQFLPTKVRQSFRSRGSKPKRNDEQQDEVRTRQNTVLKRSLT